MAKIRVNVVNPTNNKNVVGVYDDEKGIITLAGGIDYPADEIIINDIFN